LSRRKDELSQDDERLWWRVTQSVNPMPGRERPPVPRKRDVLDAEGDRADLLAEPRHTRPAAPVQPRRITPQKEVVPGAVDGVDKRQAQRFRRGQLTIDARYDLHGMRQHQAHTALNAFLARAHERGCRCVLVITGKGQKAPLEERTGVLRSQLPRWLNEPNNRHRVLAVTPAQPQHGGDGAFYILLKRSR
jgi:DNA-nicking Smr family endonuclease